jgi:twinkle protein
VELCRDFGYELDDGRPRNYRELRQPDEIIVREAAVAYMAGRGISRETCERYQVTAGSTKPNILVFPFLDETGRLRTVKYRNMLWNKEMRSSKEWFEKDTMPILFGMKQCEGFDRLVITEGQIDALSCAEAGVRNAVSVPNGAQGSSWINNCWDWLVQFKEVVVFGDNEHGHITLLDMIRSRLPAEVRVLCVRTIDYLGEKDANDILLKHGAENVRLAVENAEVPKMRNVKELADVRAVDINDLERLKTGIRELDRLIGGLVMGQVVLLSGKRGEGKSTFGGQLISAALDQNANVFAYSGELSDFHFKRWIDYQLAGLPNLEERKLENGEIAYTIKPEAVSKITEWYRHTPPRQIGSRTRPLLSTLRLV